ncbi:hypothetical protein HK103_006191 [Boothiomyces macroporosus]|uniref:glutamate-5-semialdehyde dehydrogenase n=1 Tax=Boothiomyces macroporosus TaxID=261099 RepID=A0AAD5UH91_9FUNG|nr:hypothetical protein HK103_006191 [Boothiomyces macroporosus]
MAEELASATKTASHVLQACSNDDKNVALRSIHNQLKENKDFIIQQNKLDLEFANQKVKSGELSQSLFSRLDIEKKYDSLLQGVLDIEQLPDPTGQIQLAKQLDNGLELYRVSCPVGVLLIIFEARPEVIVQISCLAIKSGNAVILKGGKEANNSNICLMQMIQKALRESNVIPADAVQLVTSRDDIATLLKLDRYVDLVIPRGSNDLVRYVQENTRIPVLGHADGICSTYVDQSADLSKAVKLAVDGKTNYPAACNSTETLLIHTSILSTHLPAIAKGLLEKNVLIRADQSAFEVLNKSHANLIGSRIVHSVAQDYKTEFLDLEIAVKTVNSVDEAIQHINTHGSKHTDCIVTESKANAQKFMKLVDAAGTYWNASTRFADGFRYGFGAEIGVSTNKTHARGPVGLEGLMIYKYQLFGNGHCVGEYSDGAGASGLIAAHKLLQSKIQFDLYEQKSHLGGVWHYDNKPLSNEAQIKSYNGSAEYIPVYHNEANIPSALYPSLHTNLPAELMGIRDYPFESVKQFPTHSMVYEYLESFAKSKGVYPHIKFSHQVENITGNKVTVNGHVTEYDYIMICNGHYAVPKIPNIRGLQDFKGRIIHSQEYRNPIDKSVLVVGGSFSGKDIAREHPGCYWSVKEPKDGQLSVVEYFTPDGFVTKEGEFKVEKVIFATGYRYSVPFCDFLDIQDGINDLYLHLLYKPNKAIMLLGLPMSVVPFHLVEYQAELCVAIMQGLQVDVNGFDLDPLEGKPKHWFGADREFIYCDYLASLYGGPKVPEWRKELRTHAAALRTKQLGY